MINIGIFVAMRRRKLKGALLNGAVIIDIREPHLFDSGHVPGSLNIPKEIVALNIEKLQQMNVPIIICGPFTFSCINTVNLLLSNGMQAYNGGSWFFVNRIQASL